MTSASFQRILDAALADYALQIGIDPTNHPFADQLQACHSPDDVLKLLEEKAGQFKDYREGNRKLINCLKPVVKVIHTLSSVLGDAIGLIPLQPAKAIFVGVDILLVAAIDVSSSYDALVDLFECLGHFLKRLRIYTDLPLTPSMTDIIVKIIVELLSVLALATKQTKQGRFKKFAKKLLGESEIEAVLQRLDRLTQEEGRMTVAQTLEVVHGLLNSVKVVMNDGKASMDGILKTLDIMQQMASDINKIRRDQLQKESRSWLSPPDPSPNYNFACETHQDGTATWFFQGSVFAEWNAMSSLLWIYGTPGSGKSILMSSIIREVDRIRKAGLAWMAYYFFDFRDTQKQHRCGLLSSFLSQLSAESDPCYRILSRLYSAHGGGTKQPSDDVLSQCLIEMLEVQGRPAVYVIIDALDECPNISEMPTAREKVLEFLEDLVNLQLPNVHICVSSRPEIDIRISLKPLAPYHVSLDEESGQKADIRRYINSVVHSDRMMRRWSAEDKQLVIDTLSEKAGGIWVYCHLKNLRQCFPSSLRSALDHLPETLDETYEQILRGIDKARRKSAYRLLQCLVVSARPLRVEELAEVLAVRFDSGRVPRFNPGWRLGDAEEAVLAACSSLITVVNVNGSQVVQFSHFSVKEFLTSDRLASAGEDLSFYHIIPHSAHSTLAQASLSVLLQLDDRINKQGIRNFPLADYAARHWFEHGQFENVSSTIQGATKCLFDQKKPHFSAWVWIYDIDDPWRESMPTKQPERPGATPLYYAVLCGFRWLIEHLLVTYPDDVDARGGYNETPLLAAIRRENVDAITRPQAGDDDFVCEDKNPSPRQGASPSEDVEIVRLLLEHNACVNLPTKARASPLSWASLSGKLEISRLLVQWGADVCSPDKSGWSPLRAASHKGHLDIVRLLIVSGADVNAQDNQGWTPLHSASQEGYLNTVGLLIRRGADINRQGYHQRTPLHLASSGAHLEVVQLLVEQGANVDSRNSLGWTPLKSASHEGHLGVVQLLIDSGADANSRDDDEWTPLLSASQEGHTDVVEFLICHGADVNVQDDHQQTPLHRACVSGHFEISRVLVEHSANVDSRTNLGWTPLKTASNQGYLDMVRFLIDSGADVNAQDNQGWAPLHSASREGYHNIVELLILHGADVDMQDDDQQTPLSLGSAKGSLEVSQLLVQHGADVHSRNTNDWTPLKMASLYGHLDVVRFLIDSGADINFRNDEGWTALHVAACNGHLDTVKLLLERGADFSIREDGERTPLDLASENGQLEVADFLHGLTGGSASLDGAANATLSTISPHNQPPPRERGEDVTPSDIGHGSLITAAENGELDIVRSLLDHGSDVNERTALRQTALSVTAIYGELDIAKLLIERGADVDARETIGWTPLLVASEFGQLEVARLLLDHGANVNASGRKHDTALHRVSLLGNSEMAQLLLERGANVDLRNTDGQTPKQLALRGGHRRVVELLSAFGA